MELDANGGITVNGVWKCVRPNCDTCIQKAKMNAYLTSPEYLAWIASVPEGMTMEENGVWTVANPPPPLPA